MNLSTLSACVPLALHSHVTHCLGRGALTLHDEVRLLEEPLSVSQNVKDMFAPNVQMNKPCASYGEVDMLVAQGVRSNPNAGTYFLLNTRTRVHPNR